MGTKYQEEVIYIKGGGFPSFITIRRKELDRYKKMGFEEVDLTPAERSRTEIFKEVKKTNSLKERNNDEYNRCISKGIIKEFGK